MASRTFSLPSLGTCTMTRMYKSPRLLSFSAGTPCPRMRNSLPLWLPGGTFTRTSPSGVGTVIVKTVARSDETSDWIAAAFADQDPGCF